MKKKWRSRNYVSYLYYYLLIGFLISYIFCIQYLLTISWLILLCADCWGCRKSGAHPILESKIFHGLACRIFNRLASATIRMCIYIHGVGLASKRLDLLQSLPSIDFLQVCDSMLRLPKPECLGRDEVLPGVLFYIH